VGCACYVCIGRICYVPASIAFGHPNADLSGIFLKPFKGLGLSQQTAFCPQKAMLAGMCHFKLGCFTINKVLISSSTVVALKCYPYPSKSIICIAYFKFLEFLNIWIFIFNSNRKTFVPTF